METPSAVAPQVNAPDEQAEGRGMEDEENNHEENNHEEERPEEGGEENEEEKRKRDQEWIEGLVARGQVLQAIGAAHKLGVVLDKEEVFGRACEEAVRTRRFKLITKVLRKLPDPSPPMLSSAVEVLVQHQEYAQVLGLAREFSISVPEDQLYRGMWEAQQFEDLTNCVVEYGTNSAVSRLDLVKELLRIPIITSASKLLRKCTPNERERLLRECIAAGCPISPIRTVAARVNMAQCLQDAIPRLDVMRLPLSGPSVQFAFDRDTLRTAVEGLQASLARAGQRGLYHVRQETPLCFDFSKPPVIDATFGKRVVIRQVSSLIENKLNLFNMGSTRVAAFPCELSGRERAGIHSLCEELHLFSRSLGVVPHRQVVVAKDEALLENLDLAQVPLIFLPAKDGRVLEHAAEAPEPTEAMKKQRREELEAQVEAFVRSEEQTLEFSNLSGFERQLLHVVGNHFQLVSRTAGPKDARVVTLYKSAPPSNSAKERPKGGAKGKRKHGNAAPAARSQIDHIEGVLGLDMESEPARERGERNKCSTLQVATEELVVVFDLNELMSDAELAATLCDFLERVFTNCNIAKLGCGFEEDLSNLRRAFPGSSCFDRMASYLDVNDAFKASAQPSTTVSLQTLCNLALGLELSKHEQCSHWAQRPLTAAQLEYAALDAFVQIPLCCELLAEGEVSMRSNVEAQFRSYKLESWNLHKAVPLLKSIGAN